MALAYGAQILVSSVTASLVDSVESVDLGEYRLRGLTRPERLHQVIAAGLPREVSVAKVWRSRCELIGAMPVRSQARRTRRATPSQDRRLNQSSGQEHRRLGQRADPHEGRRRSPRRPRPPGGSTSSRPPLPLIVTSPRRQSMSSRSRRATSEARHQIRDQDQQDHGVPPPPAHRAVAAGHQSSGLARRYGRGQGGAGPSLQRRDRCDQGNRDPAGDVQEPQE